MQQSYLTIWDLILTPVYLVILILIAKRFRDKHYPVGHNLRRYFLPGLIAKFGGAIAIVLIYQYYYGSGDTLNFFEHTRIINSSLDDSFSIWVKLLFRTSPESDPYIYRYSSQMVWYGDPASYAVPSIAALFGLLNGTTYIPIALLFALFAYSGIWAMYKTFVDIYPSLHKSLAIAFLFIPSTIIWGSGIFKDTVCIFGLGWITYTVFRIFIHRDFSFKNIAILFLSFYLLTLIKIYILLAFIPALFLWLLLSYSYKIKNTALRWVLNLLFVGVITGASFYFSDQFSQELGKYSLENVAKTAEVTRGWISYSSGEEGSAYTLGDFEPTLVGMLSKFPAAVIVTLFRPFPWEAKKLIVIFSALESILFLLGTVYVMLQLIRTSSIKKIFRDPNLIFFLVFSLIFAFAVGISSYNFGALSRYKIPCLPFYSAFLMIALHYARSSTTSLESVQLNRPKKRSSFA